MKKILQTIEDTQAFAKEIAASLKGGEVLALVGDLGAGKTTFTQLLCKELGVTAIVNSPTFVVMKEYEAAYEKIKHVIHMDAYRITNNEQMFELGLDRHISQKNSLVIIEWADKVKEYLDGLENVVWVEFRVDGDIRNVEYRMWNVENGK